jgi:uncharacterized membrane protein YqgA involved in biofilm formation
MIGTLVNTGTVALGATIGLLLNKRLPEKYTSIIFQVLGLFTIFIGIAMALKSGNYLILIFGLLTGGIIGEALRLESRINNLSDKLKNRTAKNDDKFTQGLVTAFMLFCVGSMTVIGTFEEGLTGKRDTILTKSLMDLFSSIALASAFGRGVFFSVIPLFLYQAGLTLGAEFFKDFLSPEMIDELSASGGIMLVGLGISILDLKKIRVINMLPALVMAVLLTWIAQHFGFYVV